ncbi:hypothetical protein B0T11DRAFT_137150 [Plectosphaerella cucumerina]|uniref:Uncharacterized protein n=1 Tax=Plectosphaerella cucumerina TaxID=40658 RepID=A0A8K0WZI3_9PEZI|nr:hypothetical protein B0T11DRAFT_137150 [Plectosphaerella cucumerina]
MLDIMKSETARVLATPPQETRLLLLLLGFLGSHIQVPASAVPSRSNAKDTSAGAERPVQNSTVFFLFYLQLPETAVIVIGCIRWSSSGLVCSGRLGQRRGRRCSWGGRCQEGREEAGAAL